MQSNAKQCKAIKINKNNKYNLHPKTVTMSFQYVFIPADASKDLECKEGSKDGGLSNDYLVKHAKEYFSAQSSGPSASETAGE